MTYNVLGFFKNFDIIKKSHIVLAKIFLTPVTIKKNSYQISKLLKFLEILIHFITIIEIIIIGEAKLKFMEILVIF